MRKLDRESWTWIAIGAAAAISVILVIARAPAPRTSQDWAAWVQGVGTIVAVGVAVWAGTLPARHEADRKRRETRDFVIGVSTAVEHAFMSAELLLDAIRRGDIGDLVAAHVDLRRQKAPETLEQLMTTPMQTWPSPRIFSTIARLRAAYEQLDRVCTAMKAIASPLPDSNTWAHPRWIVNELRTANDAAREALDAAYVNNFR